MNTARFYRRVVAGFATALGVAVVSMPAPAIAGTNSDFSIIERSNAKFYHSGDYIQVCDTARDRDSVYAQFRINGGSVRETSQHNGGVNTCGNKSTGNPAEGSRVSVRTAVQAELAFDKYGVWRTGRA